MSQTRQQRKQQQKRVNRQKKIRKLHNIQRNLAEQRFRLDVELNGEWLIGVKHWRHISLIEKHRDETERLRRAGQEIVAGRVVDLMTGKIILKIEASKPKGAAPDKIADGVRAADFSANIGEGEGQQVGSKGHEPVNSEEQQSQGPAGIVESEQKPEGPKGPVQKFFRILGGRR